MRRRTLLLIAAVVLALLLVPFVQRARADQLAADAKAAAEPAARCRGDHWVGAWAAAPQGSSLGRPDDLPYGTADGLQRIFEDQTLRMIVSPHTAGSALRVRIGNRFGTAPVTLDAATIGEQRTGATLVPGSVRPLTFGGSRSVLVAPGGEAVSDPLFVAVQPFQALAVSFHVVGSAALDHHMWAQSTQFVAPAHSGDHADDASGAAFTEKMTSWYGVAGIDVLAPRSVGTVVTLGDSITDGIGSSTDLDRRWPDRLAERFESAGTALSVVNAGIGGNHVVTSGPSSALAMGPSAQERLEVDALDVAGVTDLFLFEGINDIYMGDPNVDIAAAVIDGYKTIIDDAHDAGLRVIGATITPASMTGAKEAARLAINEWIRSTDAYDAVVDFDAVARDPIDPSRIRTAWDAGYAHFTDPGYEALANAINPSIFQGTGC